MKRITALILSLCLALALCACGGSAPEDTSMLGTYTLYAMDYDENTIVRTEALFDGENYITLKSGGAAEICLENDKSDVKWKAEGTKLVFTASDGDMDGSLSNGVLTLVADDSKLYFVANEAAKGAIKALTLDEVLYGASSEPVSQDEPEEPAPETPAMEAPSGPSEVQAMWNGWYFGCIDLDDCTGEWAELNGNTYDTVMYIELDRDGVGRFAIYDSFGILISNEWNNIYVDAACHADTSYLYADGGEAFGCELNTHDWIFVHNLSMPEKLNFGSSSTNDAGETIGYDFQFRPWGDRWEEDPYSRFIPYFSAYLSALDAGLTNPFGDTFPGFGIAEPLSNGGGEEQPAQPSSGSGANSALLGSDPTRLDVNDRGILYVYYPADQFAYDDWYGKLKNEESGVGILIDPMLGATNLAELKASYEEHNSDEDDYSLTETTVNGCKALVLTYSDWLGATMRVDLDFGGNHDGWYGVSFAVSGDSLEDCNSELVWAIIESMELAK